MLRTPSRHYGWFQIVSCDRFCGKPFTSCHILHTPLCVGSRDCAPQALFGLMSLKNTLHTTYIGRIAFSWLFHNWPLFFSSSLSCCWFSLIWEGGYAHRANGSFSPLNWQMCNCARALALLTKCASQILHKGRYQNMLYPWELVVGSIHSGEVRLQKAPCRPAALLHSSDELLCSTVKMYDTCLLCTVKVHC